MSSNEERWNKFRELVIHGDHERRVGNLPKGEFPTPEDAAYALDVLIIALEDARIAYDVLYELVSHVGWWGPPKALLALVERQRKLAETGIDFRVLAETAHRKKPTE